MKKHLNKINIHGLNVCAVLAFILLANLTTSGQQSVNNDLPKPFKNLSYKIKCDWKNSEIEKRILFEYGAVYISRAFEKRTGEIPCRFENETQVLKFLDTFSESANKLNFGKFYLQPQAKESLEFVIKELKGYKNVARNYNGTTTKELSTNKDINDDWSFRTYAQTLFNWCNGHSERCPGVICDSAKKSCTGILDLVTTERLVSVKNELNRPLMFRVAIPGGSQHHLGLAIDVNDGRANKICDKNCISILEKNGWYRTIPFDNYHFTYLGFLEFELPGKGLKKIRCKENQTDRDWVEFWVPDIEENYAGYRFLEDRCKDVN